MWRRSKREWAVAGLVMVVLAVVLPANRAAANDEELKPARRPMLAQLMPPNSLFFVEINDPDPLVTLALAPALHERLHEIEAYRDGLQSKGMREFRVVVAVLEVQLETSWREALPELIGGGMALAFDPQTQGAVLIVRARNQARLHRLHEVLVELTEQDAQDKGHPSPIHREQYRDITLWSFGGEEQHALLDNLLVISNRTATLRGVVDRYMNPESASLAQASEYQQARSSLEGQPVGWGFLRLEPLRQLPQVQKALSQRGDNAGAVLLLGDLVENFRQSPYVVGELYREQDRLRMRLKSPHDRTSVSSSSTGFFAPAGQGAAYGLLWPKSALASFSFYRDFGALWLARDELLNEVAAAQLVQADNNLGQFFAGRDFGTEVLGEFGPRHQLVIAHQEYPPSLPEPEIKLPSFAMIWELKNPDEFSPVLLVAYQKIVGLANLLGGAENQPQLLLSTESYRGVTISKAEYLPPSDPDAPGRINYNFSPSSARVGRWFILSSSIGLVRELVDTFLDGEESSTGRDHLLAKLDVAGLTRLLKLNRQALVTQNMLEQGHSQAEAEKAIDGLLAVVELVQEATMRLGLESDHLILEISVELAF